MIATILQDEQIESGSSRNGDGSFEIIVMNLSNVYVNEPSLLHKNFIYSSYILHNDVVYLLYKLFKQGVDIMLGIAGRYGMMRGGFGIEGGIMMGFCLLVLILVVVYVYKKHNDTNGEPLELLKMKFVKGEINEEEYLSKKNILIKK